MESVRFQTTLDGSTGLFDKNANDIFHDIKGAYTEALEKFVLPVCESGYMKTKTELNTADICFGIGYNTKAFLNSVSDIKINVNAFEYNPDFAFLSPFIKDNINNPGLKIDLFYQLLKYSSGFDEIYTLFDNYVKKYGVVFFDPDMRRFIEFLKKEGYVYNPSRDNRTFLHNIYYSYISDSMENCLKLNNNAKFNFELFSGDARVRIKQSKTRYDIVFLDGFSPQKSPILWSIDFLREVKNRMSENSILVSYSKSVPFRNALKILGLNVGKNILNGTEIGTVAATKPDYIINPPNDFESGLLETRAGIVYKDPCLNLDGDIILKNRANEAACSKLISHTQYLKSRQ